MAPGTEFFHHITAAQFIAAHMVGRVEVGDD
jgi:hypothetical protein